MLFAEQLRSAELILGVGQTAEGPSTQPGKLGFALNTFDLP